MNELYLVINCGSSSLKFSLYKMPSEELICKGYVEKIGYEDCFWNISYNDKKITGATFIKSHDTAVKMMIDTLIDNNIITSMNDIKGIGHRILHGGELYSDSVLIDDSVLLNLNNMINLGPLHLPGEIDGIKAISNVLPDTKQVAVFDTAFHHTIPEDNYIYAIPYEWYTKYKVRKYGFHGTSHKYITEYMQNKFGKKDINLIICHVGSGASITCVKNGLSYDTSMGLTPLDGLVMGTRSGSIDASLISYMINETNKSLTEIMTELNKNSGLKGICGKNDFRDLMTLVDKNDKQAILAYNIFINSIIRYISDYYFMLDANVDALVFTAGILENNVKIRHDIIDKISNSMNIYLDDIKNNEIGYGLPNKEGIITLDKSQIPCYVIPTNEEIMIARDCYHIIKELSK